MTLFDASNDEKDDDHLTVNFNILNWRNEECDEDTDVGTKS